MDAARMSFPASKPRVRVIAPAAWQPALDTATQLGLARLEREPVALGSLQRAGYIRLLLERKAARGWDHLQAERALGDPSTAALTALLAGDCDAVLLSGACDQAALSLLEPSPGLLCAPLWEGEANGRRFGCLDAPHRSSATVAALLRSAAAWRAARWGRPTLPVVVTFAGGKNPQAATLAEAAATLLERGEGRAVPLYSPLFYRNGQLDTTLLLDEIHARIKSAAEALLWIPQIAPGDLGAGLVAAGGTWAGAFLSGAERPVACIAEHTAPEHVLATLRGLLQAVSNT